MSGIYIHIPFCKQKCSYCDFHFSTDTSYRSDMVQTLIEEIGIKSDGSKVETIYFGGGTPTLLDPDELTALITAVHNGFQVDTEAEVTLEANPDDILADRPVVWKQVGINRLSIGIQSFDDRDLSLMNRAHDASMATTAIERIKRAGFDNVTVDMIYGLPDRTLNEFHETIKRFISLEVDHISAYNLTIEKGTLFHHLNKKGTLAVPDEDEVGEQFLMLRDSLQSAGYEQYEVSNFARDGKISRHNSAYWLKRPYVGIGPSAHSFDGSARQWNISNNSLYMKAISEGRLYHGREELSMTDRYNEYMLTRSRTKWGLDLDYLKNEFNVDLDLRFAKILNKYADKSDIQNGHLVLNASGLLVADAFASDLFIIE